MSAPAAIPDPPHDDQRAQLDRLVLTHQAVIWRYLRFVGCSVAVRTAARMQVELMREMAMGLGLSAA